MNKSPNARDGVDLKKAFADQPEHIKNLAFNKPEFWNLTLFVELLKHGLKKPLEDFERVEKRQLFTSKRKMKESAIFGFYGEKSRELGELRSKAADYLNNDVTDAISDFEPIKFIEANNKAVSLIRELTKWKKDLLSIETPDFTKHLVSLLLQMPEGIANSIKETIQKVEDIRKLEAPKLEEPEAEYTISFSINLPTDLEESIAAEFKMLQSRYDALNDLSDDLD